MQHIKPMKYIKSSEWHKSAVDKKKKGGECTSALMRQTLLQKKNYILSFSFRQEKRN